MELILKNVKKKDVQLLKRLSKSLGFEIVEKEAKPYNTAFVNEILAAEKSIEEGKGTKMTQEEIDKLWK